MMEKIQYISQGRTVEDHLDNIKLACEAGMKWIQLRIKKTDQALILDAALKTKEICERHGATFILNDHVEIAKSIGIDGVHLGKKDMSPREARSILGNGFIIGGTANTLEDCVDLVDAGVDYIGLGPYRFTTTKEELSPMLGTEGYQKIINELKDHEISIPIIAIGGIRLEDLSLLRKTGVYGVAFSGLLTHAEDRVEVVSTCQNILS